MKQLNADNYYVDPEDIKLEALVDSVENKANDKPKTVLYNIAYELVAPKMSDLITDIAKYRAPEERIVPFFQDHINASSFFKAVGYSFNPHYVAKMFNVVTRILIEESLRSKNKELELLKVPPLMSDNETKIVNAELIEIKGDMYFKNSELNIYDNLKKKAFNFINMNEMDIDYVAFIDQGLNQLIVGESHKEKLYTKYWLTQAFMYMKGILRQDNAIRVDGQKNEFTFQAEELLEQLNDEGGKLTINETQKGKLFLQNLDPKYNTGAYAGTLDKYRIKMVPLVLAALQRKKLR